MAKLFVVNEQRKLEDKTPVGVSRYELCEFYFFRHTTVKPGFAPCYGTQITNAATTYPRAWAYLQTSEGQLLCKSEVDWMNMSTASPWNGVGGVPFFSLDLGTGALRLPDVRGMYAEAALFDGLNVGGVNGPGVPNITGKMVQSEKTGSSNVFNTFTGAFDISDRGTRVQYVVRQPNSAGDLWGVDFDASRVSGIYGSSSTVRPRSFGVLPCVYLGA